jgi:hypothetical protein
MVTWQVAGHYVSESLAGRPANAGADPPNIGEGRSDERVERKSLSSPGGYDGMHAGKMGTMSNTGSAQSHVSKINWQLARGR